MFFLLYRQIYRSPFFTDCLHRTAVKEREMTSSISSLVRIWKIRHSGPGCSFVWILRVVYFSVKHSCLYNKIYYLRYIHLHSSLCSAGVVHLQNNQHFPRASAVSFYLAFLACILRPVSIMFRAVSCSEKYFTLIPFTNRWFRACHIQLLRQRNLACKTN